MNRKQNMIFATIMLITSILSMSLFGWLYYLIEKGTFNIQISMVIGMVAFVLLVYGFGSFLVACSCVIDIVKIKNKNRR